MTAIEKEIEEALSTFHGNIMEHIDRQVRTFAYALLAEAYGYRMETPGSHNFTGNLVNSIVVCVYKKGRPYQAYYASEQGLPKAIRFKMTAPKEYHFKKDYDGEESYFQAKIKTNQGWGEDDAKEFFRSYSPGYDVDFCIVVAYPTEYADFVESYRHTTGFIGTYKWAKRNAGYIIGVEYTNYFENTVEVPF